MIRLDGSACTVFPQQRESFVLAISEPPPVIAGCLWRAEVRRDDGNVKSYAFGPMHLETLARNEAPAP